jgi:hypothetical protein
VTTYSKHIRKLLRKWADEAYFRELNTHLEILHEQFHHMEKGSITAFELSEHIHEFHQGPARDLYVKYGNDRNTDWLVAVAISDNLISKGELEPELLEALADRLKQTAANSDSEVRESSGEQMIDDFPRKTSITVARADCKKNQPTTFVFSLVAQGIDAGQMSVSIDKHYPEEIAEQVARTFLYRRLLALAEEAKHGTLSDEDLKALWAKYKPAHYPK